MRTPIFDGLGDQLIEPRMLAREPQIENPVSPQLLDWFGVLESGREVLVECFDGTRTELAENRSLALVVLIQGCGAHTQPSRDGSHGKPLLAQLGAEFEAHIQDRALDFSGIHARPVP